MKRLCNAPDGFPVNHCSELSEWPEAEGGRVRPQTREPVVVSPPSLGYGKEECLLLSDLQMAMSVPNFLTSKLPNCICLRLSLFSIASEMNC